MLRGQDRALRRPKLFRTFVKLLKLYNIIYSLLNGLYPPTRAFDSALPTPPRFTTFLFSQARRKIRAARRINRCERLGLCNIPLKHPDRGPSKQRRPKRGAPASRATYRIVKRDPARHCCIVVLSRISTAELCCVWLPQGVLLLFLQGVEQSEEILGGR